MSSICSSERLARDASTIIVSRPSEDQTALLVAEALGRPEDVFNLVEAVSIVGAVEAGRIEAALALLIERHGMLRTSFHRSVDEWERRTSSTVDLRIFREDLSSLGEPPSDGEVVEKALEFGRARFDLTVAPLIRFLIIKRSEELHAVVLAVHHIVADGWSLGVLLREFQVIYAGGRDDLRQVEAEILPAAETVRAEDAARPAAAPPRDRPDRDVLPTDWQPPNDAPFAPRSICRELNAAAWAALAASAARSSVTRNTVLVAALADLLRAWRGRADVVIGMPVANRSGRKMRDAVGLFTSMTSVRLSAVDGPLSTYGLAATQAAIRQAAKAARGWPHGRRSGTDRREARGRPTGGVTFNYIPWDAGDLAMAGASVSRLPLPNIFSKADLAFYVRNADRGGAEIELVYDAVLYEAATARALLDWYWHLLTATPRPAPPLRSLDRPERHDGGVLERLAAHAKDRGSASAIRFGGVDLSYREVDAASDRIARALAAEGVGRGDAVAAVCTRNHAMPLMVLGIWKAGAVAVPLDGRHPLLHRERLSSLAGAKLALVDEASDAGVAAPALRVPSLSPVSSWFADHVDGRVVGPAGPDSPAVIQFTSGSAGTPKAVVSAHAPLARFLRWQAEEFGFDVEDRFSLLSGIGHDPSLRDMFAPLWTGARLEVPPQAAIDDGSVAGWLTSSGVTVAHLTPAMGRVAFSAGQATVPRLRWAFFGGDVVRPSDVALCRTASGAGCVVFYGTTETPQAVLFHLCDDAAPSRSRIPIGRPISGVAVEIHDASGALVGPLEVGELVIRGSQLSQGYLGASPEAEANFLPPACGAERGYRTGDLARRRADGSVELLGRRDAQVKVRGFRVEPGEVEAALASVEAVRQAVVLSRPDASGENALAGFFVADPGSGAASPHAECGVFFFGDGAFGGDADTYVGYKRAAKAAEDAGLVACWTPERHFTDVAAAYPNPSLLSAALAAATHRISLRAGSVVAPLHHPVRLAEDWAVVDRLSGGRAQVALAGGWLADDFVLAPTGYADRKRTVADTVPILRALWGGEPVMLPNGLGKDVAVRIRPLPAAKAIPLWLTATASPDTFDLARELGTGVLTALNNQSLDDLAANIGRLRRGPAAGGATPKVALMLHTFLADTDAEARSTAAPALRDYLRQHAGLRVGFLGGPAAVAGMDVEDVLDVAVDRVMRQGLFGSPATCASRLQSLGSLGVDEVACLIDFGVPLEATLRSIGLIGEAVRLASAARASLSPAEVRAALDRRLPGHMVPATLVRVDAIPLTDRGKVDALALMESLDAQAAVPRPAFVPPATAAERLLCDAAAGAFGLPRVGLDDDFFELGGYSLLALKLSSRFAESAGVPLAVGSIFQLRTMRAIAAALPPLPAAGEAQPPPIAPAAAAGTSALSDAWPLSAAQASLWMAEELGDRTGLMNVTATLRIRGPLRVDALMDGFAAVVSRHLMLRAQFVRRDDAIVQRDAAATDLAVTKAGAGEDEAALDARVRRFARQPIDRFSGPPFRALVIVVGPEDHLVALTAHHTASDGESLRIVLSDLAELYTARVVGRAPALPPVASHYGLHALAAAARPTQGEAAERLRGLADALAGADHVLEFPGAQPRTPGIVRRGASCSLPLPADLVEAASAFCAEQACTAFALFHAVFGLLLGNYARKDDLLCGVAVAGRPMPEHEGTVGLFANLLVTRVRLGEGSSFLDLVRASARRSVDILTCQDLRFEWLLDELKPARTNDRHPLVQAVITVQDAARPPQAMAGLDVEFALGDQTEQVLFDLTLAATRVGAGWRLRLDYAHDVFDAPSAQGFLQAYLHLLAEGVARPDAGIWTLDLLDPASRRDVIERRSGTDAAVPAAPVHDLVLEWAARRPEAAAVRFRDAVTTYGALAAASEAMAYRLVASGVEPGDVVGVHMRRTPEMVATLLAILRCGGAYLPLDTGLPSDRLQLLVANSAARLVVTDAEGDGRAVFGTAVLDAAEAESRLGSEGTNLPRVGADGIASVLFTSGSTGVPKGVLIPHAGIVRLVRNTDYIRIEPSDVVLHANTLSFDLSNFDIWGALANGAALALIDDELPRLDAIEDGLARHGATVALLATGVFHALVEEAPEAFLSLTTALVAGDVLSPGLAARILSSRPGLMLVNGYGPTECSTFATAWCADNGTTVPTPVPIGRPIANTRAYVLNRELRPVPDGMVAELYLGGPGVARGYVQRDDLTAERFIPSPFRPDDRLYRTGDLVRWRSDGGLDFLGREDMQVKIRGVRVETGEVEAAIRACTGGAEAVVLPEGEGDARALTAFVMPARGTTVDARELTASLAGRLPAYLVPSRVCLVGSMPLTVNGKIDRKALLRSDFGAPDPASAGTTNARMDRPAPRRPAERLVSGVVSDVLDIPAVDLDEDFFALGGNSLSGLRIVTRLRKMFGVDVSLAAIFANPTVRGMVDLLERTEAHKGRTEAVARARLEIFAARSGDTPRSADRMEERGGDPGIARVE